VGRGHGWKRGTTLKWVTRDSGMREWVWKIETNGYKCRCDGPVEMGLWETEMSVDAVEMMGFFFLFFLKK
jgi:hypothetical protein